MHHLIKFARANLLPLHLRRKLLLAIAKAILRLVTPRCVDVQCVVGTTSSLEFRVAISSVWVSLLHQRNDPFGFLGNPQE